MRTKNVFFLKSAVIFLLVLLSGFTLAQTESEKVNKTYKITAFTNVNLIPMTSQKVITGQTVLIEDNRIIRILPTSKFKAPKGAKVIDGTGKYLMPGLADMHTHIGTTRENADLNQFVAYGVTTIRDLPQDSPPTVLKLRDEINAGKRFGPTIFVANHLSGKEIDPSNAIQSTRNSGYNGVKLNSFFTTKEFHETMIEVRKSNLYALGHLPFLVSLDDILNDGYRESSHVLELAWYLTKIDIKSAKNGEEAGARIFGDLFNQLIEFSNLPDKEVENILRPKIKMIVDKIGKRDFSFSTTMITDYDIMNKLLNIDVIRNSNYAKYISKSFWANIKNGKDKHLNMFSSNLKIAAMVYKMSCMILHELIAQNKFLVLGTDVGPTFFSYIPGLSVHQELSLLVDNGLTPYQALTTATKNASIIAKKMGGKDDFGVIKIGRKADLLLLDENPLKNIANTQKITGVFIRGKYYTQSKLDSINNINQKLNVKELIGERYKTSGIDEAIKLYLSLRADNYYNTYGFNETTLLIPAYELAKNGLMDEALKLFLLNAEEYPYAPNAFDSLGEIYLKMGKKQPAIDNYKKALMIDPNFENSIKALKELQ